MKLSFFPRLALALVAVFIVIMVAFLGFTGYLQAITKSEAEQKLHLGLAEHLVGDNPLLQQGVYDYSALKNLFHTLMIMGPDFEFYYLDPRGHILTYSAEAGKVKRKTVELAPVLAVINGADNFPIYGDDPRQPDKQKIFSAAPVYNNDQLQGYLYVIIGGEIHDSVWQNLQSNQQLNEFALVVIAGLVFLLIVVLGLFHYFTCPLRRLTTDIEKICAIDFKQERSNPRLIEWKKDSDNEIDRLGCAFSNMLLHIDRQFEQLQEIDSQRRVLLADLSHDLRTPLANLQGYIETLQLKGDSLSEKDRIRFIDISLKNARNLKRLIDQIFELAYLEGGQVTLNQESFPVGELMHDVAAKFALKAQAKNIQLSIHPSQFDYQVFTDIEKLERVLTNLLDNAIRHTPEGGHIDIVVSGQRDKIRVDIRDSGRGISDTEVALIFNARYQATNSEKDENLHAGLGLAICRKLMKLLESDLTVQSEIGKGTCFSFELKLA